MRVVVTGASGNVGTSVLSALARDPAFDAIIAVARRPAQLQLARTTWRAADVRDADLTALFAGADAVVHLAWMIQPSHDEELMRSVNVDGSERVFHAVAAAGVARLVYASSVGTYAPGPKDHAVDEGWPTSGVATSHYSRHKAAVERILDRFEAHHPQVHVVRLRPGLIFKREAASEIRRLFIGPLVPRWLFRRSLIAAVPRLQRLRFQAVHSEDIGEAYRLALRSRATGAFNLAADPVLDSQLLARTLGARQVPVRVALLRGLMDLSWRLHLQPADPGWLDMALGVPVMDTARARSELGWTPRHSSTDALLELLDGLRHGAGMDTPPLQPAAWSPRGISRALKARYPFFKKS